MKSMKKIALLILCGVMATALLTGCASEAKKDMQSTVKSANELLDKNQKPYDPATKTALKKAIKKSEDAKDDKAYKKSTKEIKADVKAYKDSVKQLKQVTRPKESFLVERAKTVPTVTAVEAATEATDENKLLNKKGGYTSYVAMRSSMVNDEYGYYSGMSPVQAGNDGGAVIEAYKTVKEAKAREKYLSRFDGASMLSPGTHKVVGTLLVRTSNELTASQQKELENNIINALVKLE